MVCCWSLTGTPSPESFWVWKPCWRSQTLFWPPHWEFSLWQRLGCCSEQKSGKQTHKNKVSFYADDMLFYVPDTLLTQQKLLQSWVGIFTSGNCRYDKMTLFQLTSLQTYQFLSLFLFLAPFYVYNYLCLFLLFYCFLLCFNLNSYLFICYVFLVFKCVLKIKSTCSSPLQCVQTQASYHTYVNAHRGKQEVLLGGLTWTEAHAEPVASSLYFPATYFISFSWKSSLFLSLTVNSNSSVADLTVTVLEPSVL